MKIKRLLAVTCLMCALPLLFADGRVDLGVLIPLGFGGIVGGDQVNHDVTKFFQSHIIPFPEAGIYYTLDTPPFRFGLGARAFTFILESMAWPNAFAELELGHVVLQGQIGGGAFLLFGLYNSVKTGSIFFPDASAWFKLGETFRVGCGVVGIFYDKISDASVPVVFYIGGKAAIKF